MNTNNLQKKLHEIERCKDISMKMEHQEIKFPLSGKNSWCMGKGNICFWIVETYKN